MRVKLALTSLVSLAVVGLALAVAPAHAATELELPRPIPGAKVTQQVGLTEIAVEYDCAPTKGRKVWGGLVPYDRPWTIAANPAAKIRFSKDVTIGDKLVPAGAYWLLATPGKSAWTFMLNKGGDTLTSARDYKPELDIARVKVPVKSASHRERITFLFSDLTDDRTSLDLEWDNVRVSVPIQVNTMQQIEAAIGGLDNTWRAFANAARYMLETKKDYDAGLKYIEQSLALQALEHKQDWYSLWIKGALLAGKGQYGQAHDLAQSAYDLAKASGGAFYLEPELSKAIADWGKKTRPFEKEHAVATATTPPSPGVTPPSATTPPPVATDDAKVTPTLEKTSTPPANDPPLRRARLRKK